MVSMTIKGLLWVENYRRVLENLPLLPPIGVALDLTDICNLNCYWCNAKKFRSNNVLPTNHIKKVINMLSNWGVKSICFAGGGEPTLHLDIGELIEFAHRNRLEVAMSTNGINLTKELIFILINCCRFVGISVDAAKEKTWRLIKRNFNFNRIIDNIKELARASQYSSIDITYKFLITPDNQYEILDACKLAKGLGCSSFFARPVYLMNTLSFDYTTIEHQIKCCKELEDASFRVYTNFERVNKDYSKRNSFTKCLASVVLPVFCADGYVYLCVDHRQNEKYRLCKHLELRDYWGSLKHRELIDSICPSECPRCTLGNYNEQAEAYFKDSIFKQFP